MKIICLQPIKTENTDWHIVGVRYLNVLVAGFIFLLRIFYQAFKFVKIFAIACVILVIIYTMQKYE